MAEHALATHEDVPVIKDGKQLFIENQLGGKGTYTVEPLVKKIAIEQPKNEYHPSAKRKAPALI